MSSSTIAMIAPVSPFRGGISQHSTMLAKALDEVTELQVISYARLYPKLFYPGEFQRNSASDNAEIDAVFTIDTLNPVTWCSAVRNVLRSNARIVIIPWWTFFLAPCYVVITQYMKRAGIKVVFVVHNYSDHEAAWWKRLLSRVVLARGSFFLVHSESIRKDLDVLAHDKPCLVAPMPIFDDYPDPSELLPRRAGLELLFFGFVRHYKGLDLLLRAVADLERSDWRLSVVGECWDDADQYRRLAKELGIDDKVDFEFRYVSDSETASFISRADALVLPYRSATGSAVIPLAYHYDTPVVVTPVGGLPEVVEEGKTGFVLPAVSASALTERLEKTSAEEFAEMVGNIRQWKATNNWGRLAATLLDMVL